ncbi:ATP-dependent DNA ligase [Mycobacterium sp. CBMA271]|uniref:ATP-dependent DNA ligase n=1 Tax=unclassified Mycobacteroides TaxID=2618759 RepID=UPI0012DBD886|nr:MULTISPECIES: ATP-dependent DNA ligase [unclassified Mycobacteroides]MUM15525.1 ATP-dependent DNA ligase [Mycobacteroides sp. CBMA 326]MUM17320.1 ATP-dependent DNA ligase [Mycobacteroides sp. CBMA 326]MUM21792.1 ATP-dependent DNA ligase [Mycobacteroides sp. CBMA 271]
MERIPQVWPTQPTAGPSVRLSNAEKVLYPMSGTTKSDIFGYYTAIAPFMLPHIAGRPVTRKRWPNGVDQPSFFEKDLASSAPDWLPRRRIEHKSRYVTYPLIDTSVALAWIAQQAALEVHVPQWRFLGENPGPATRLVFDLDPGEGVSMSQLATVARAVRDVLDDIGLTTFPLTSGSKGIHLYVPLAQPVSSSGAVTVAKKVAVQLEQAMPDLATATMTRQQRGGKVFVDWSQNSGSKTTVAPYSLRGRHAPTVAAPRTWAELDDPELRQLRFDEVLVRAERDGDLLAGFDDAKFIEDRLSTYRSMRDPARTPEPVPAVKPETGQNNSFVIQEHHATALHFDFRLERDGVLVSWAVPKNLPMEPSVNHLAVHTEDHPLEYGTFEGSIPKGEYGGGEVTIWDSGTYDTEKFIDPRDDSEAAGGQKGEVIVTLHGTRISGRYALIRTNGKQWLAHRMKDQRSPATMPVGLAPMLPTTGSVAGLGADEWAFEGKWDGYRLILECDRGQLRALARSGRDVTAEFPELQRIAHELADHRVVLDGEVVVLDPKGLPSFTLLQNRTPGARTQFWAFDLLYLDGKSLLHTKYRDRRRLLDVLGAGTESMTVPESLSGDGAEAHAFSQSQGWEGVVAKRLDSTYAPGRTQSWVKAKNWSSQEVVIGGWRQGQGGRSSGIGALLMGIPGKDGLRYAGRVGTGFTEKELASLKAQLEPLHRAESPFNAPLSAVEVKDVQFVEPVLVAEVRYGDRTPGGILKHSSWRGLRTDKSVRDVELDLG